MKSSGFFSLGKVLIAAVAICAAAPTAKADLTLDFTSNGSTTSMSITPTATGSGLVVGNFTVSYAVSETYTNGVESLSVQVTAVKGNGGTSANASALAYSLTDTNVTTPPDGGTLKNGLTSSFTNGGTNQTASSLATYQDGNGTINTTTSASIPGINTPYVLETSGQVRHAANGSTSTFTSTASVIGVPEPTGVIAALAGLPCMGLVIGFARRRRALEQAAAM
jgi:hypothetical protein